MEKPVLFLCRRKYYSGGKPIKFKNQRTQRDGKLRWWWGHPKPQPEHLFELLVPSGCQRERQLTLISAFHPYFSISALFISAFHLYLFLHFILTRSGVQSAAPPRTQVRLWRRESNLTHKAAEASPKGSRGAAAAWAVQQLHWPSSTQNKTFCSRLSFCLCKGKKK